MLELVLKNPQAKKHFKFACEMYDNFLKYSEENKNDRLHPKKWAFMGTFIEECLRLEFNATSKTKHQDYSVDFNLPDGKTLQLKTSIYSRKQITCTYTGNEDVDMMLILNVIPSKKKLLVLYYGPFKQFIAHVNKHTKVLPKDNHMMPKKSLVMEANDLFGVDLPNTRTYKGSKFFIYDDE